MKKYILLFTVLLMVFCGGQEGQVHEEEETLPSAEPQAAEHEEDE